MAANVRWSLKIEQQVGWSYDDILGIFKMADAGDFFHAVFLNDHLYGSSLEPWTTLSAMFVQTERIRGGTMVTSNSFRHPTILAKLTTTIDIISKGRFLLGLGAGNEEEEYVAYGLRFPPPGERVKRLDEACQILMAAWSGEKTSFAGPYIKLQDAVFAPRPVQQPHPYLILGVKGDRALRIALKYADEWNWNRSQADTEEFLGRMDKLDELCDAAGRDPATLPRSIGFRRIYADIRSGKETLASLTDIAQRCIKRGAGHVVFMLGQPEDADREVALIQDEFIPAVMARVSTMA